MALDFISRFIKKLYGGKSEASSLTNSDTIAFFNTLGRKKEVFKSQKKHEVGMYNCGPTVYAFAHIGNLRSYVFADTLRKTLEYNGFKVNQVINITDVGHLTDDEDQGEDKIELGAKRENKTAKEISDFFTEAFLEDLATLNIQTGSITFPKATEHILEQIAFIQTLEEKGYTYKTSDGIYFDTSKFPAYGKLGNINVKGLKEGSRVEKNLEKKHGTDFALWKFSPLASSGQAARQQEWPSPWGVCFPGWHIECSAMSMKYLGKTFDIHTGGIDHIPVHHNNEIAQSEAATGKTFVKYWLHNEFLTIEGRKISKSLGNTIYLKNITDRGISPLSYRFWLLTSHYRTMVNFTWEALEGAQTALFKIHKLFVEKWGKKIGAVSALYAKKFKSFLNDDLDTPKVVALLFELAKDERVSNADKRATILEFDKVLSVGFREFNLELQEMLRTKIAPEKLPEPVRKILAEREKTRAEKNWQKADELRAKILDLGFEVQDTENGQEVYLKH